MSQHKPVLFVGPTGKTFDFFLIVGILKPALMQKNLIKLFALTGSEDTKTSGASATW